MIVIAGTVRLRPGTLQDALRVGRTMEEATAREPGCIAYRFYVDPYDETTIFVFEVWETAEALAAHFQTPHMAVFNQALPSYLAGAPQLQRYEVSHVAPMG